MNSIVSWIKSNILVVVLLLVVIFFLWRSNAPVPFVASLPVGSRGVESISMNKMGIADSMVSPIYPNSAPPTDQSNRLVVRDTSLSLVTTDVGGAIRKIEDEAVRLGGYMVDSNMTQPEGAASGTITVRVPSEKRTQALDAFKGVAVKTVSESVSGTDVTDQYVDLQARMDVLTKTKAKFEDILVKAEKVQDLLEVQRELTNIQAQIDGLKGQQKYLEQTAKLSKITMYLSTDELALPYTPDQPWRPSAIFKEAVRSFIGSIRGVGSALIWVGVYAPIWLPVLILLWWLKRKHT